MKLYLWRDLLWDEGVQDPQAYCAEHRIKLDILDELGNLWGQDNPSSGDHLNLVCPTDGKQYPIPEGSYWTLQRQYLATLESLNMKDAEIVSIDGYQIPIVKSDTPVKDTEYWAQVRINDTKRGKQLVVYAGKRGDADKTQIFIDTENDKITFDQNNMHPNDVFTKLIADFRSGNKTTMDSPGE
jgi:hypothetical protein